MNREYMMRMRHVASHQLSRLRRRYPFLRRVTATTTLVTLVWIYLLYWGERSVFTQHIAACDWSQWESWPRDAKPHHLVFIADPQLVDPHTYPGRPWPLSTLTEKYTDAYMARNFRLINQHLDPDSIVFLGDLFDGGREWAPEPAKSLKSWQRQFLDERNINSDQGKRSWSSYKASTSKQPAQAAWETEYVVPEAAHGFRPGENGRWSPWGQEQWNEDLRRFARIFYAPEQLYPQPARTIFPAFELHDTVGVENGADNTPVLEYATAGGKQRQLIASLPGNHDLGFGALVQLSVRDRFVSHFGNPNRIDVIGNHTFVSIDAPSLSAHSQYMTNGHESDNQQIQDVKHLWAESIDFIEDVRTPASKVVNASLDAYFPGTIERQGWQHDVVDPTNLPHATERGQHAQLTKPKLPVVLLTHVPLYRPPDSGCGKQREKGQAIPISMGYQYQNIITQSLSKDIVTKVSGAGDIDLIFSGDDHDYCDMNHRYNLPPWPQSDGGKSTLRNIREVTVKSFSWAMGVRKPGFQLVSLWNPIDADGESLRKPSPTIQTHLCLLPDQLSTFVDYALLLAHTLPILLFRAVVLALRRKSVPEIESDPSTPTKTVLPRFMPKVDGWANGSANGYARPTDKFKERTGRNRASSTSTSSNANNNNTLQVQRSYTARTRSVSPALGAANNLPTPGLIEKAGYFPTVRWHDPGEADESDEESHAGTEALSDIGDDYDSQAKWKWRQRTPGPARRALEEFGSSLLIVGVPALLWYAVLIKNG